MVSQARPVQLVDEPDPGLGNLPVQLAGLLGRDAALEELRSLLWRTRLLTLTGLGGVGKSRLAAALADAVRDDFVGGAWWADLSSTVEPNLVGQKVAASVVPDAPVSDPEAAIAHRLAGSSLLVLDNCEDIVPACANLVLDLLARVPALRIIVTSHQPLEIPGEQVWRVPGLVVEGFSRFVGRDEAPDEGAIALFMQRAQAAAGAFQPEYAGTREVVAEICLWLDGMPLAIELAAARVSVLSVGHIAEKLKRDADLLRQGAPVGTGRNRTLQDALEWSHQLLDSLEQLLFRRLAVFRGSFSLAAAEFVCADELVPEGEILELLGLLIEHSLVQVTDSAEGPRYRLLAAVRQYAAGKLTASGEAEPIRKRHAEFFYRLGELGRTSSGGGDQLRWLERLGLEHENVSDALHWMFEHSPIEAAQLVSALWPFYYQHGYYSEARSWFEHALEFDGVLAPVDLIDLLLNVGEVTFLQCDYPVATEHLRRALELTGPDGDQYAAATALQRLGSIGREQGRYEESRELHERSMAIWQARGDHEGVALSQNYLAFVAWLSCDLELAESAGLKALEEFRRMGSLRDVAPTLVNLGASALYRDYLDLATQRLDEALAIARRLGFQEGVAWSVHELAILRRRQHRSSRESELMLRDALLVYQQLGDRWRIASVLEEIAGGVLTRHNPALAASLLACAHTLRERIGAPIPPAEAPDREAALDRVRSRLGAAGFDAAWSQGRVLELAGAIGMALDSIDRVDSETAESVESRPVPILTPRELAVLELLSQGQTNREIGAALYISSSTAGVHVCNILRKLGAERRTDAAAIAQSLGLLAAH